MIIFARNDWTRVMKVIEDVTPNHRNFLRFMGRKDETWFDYRFHVEGDRNREVKLAVLLFAIPI